MELFFCFCGDDQQFDNDENGNLSQVDVLIVFIVEDVYLLLIDIFNDMNGEEVLFLCYV